MFVFVVVRVCSVYSSGLLVVTRRTDVREVCCLSVLSLLVLILVASTPSPSASRRTDTDKREREAVQKEALAASLAARCRTLGLSCIRI